MEQEVVNHFITQFREKSDEKLVENFVAWWICTKQVIGLNEAREACRLVILERMKARQPGTHEIGVCIDEIGGPGTAAAYPESNLVEQYEQEQRFQQGGPDPDPASEFQGY